MQYLSDILEYYEVSASLLILRYLSVVYEPPVRHYFGAVNSINLLFLGSF